MATNPFGQAVDDAYAKAQGWQYDPIRKTYIDPTPKFDASGAYVSPTGSGSGMATTPGGAVPGATKPVAGAPGDSGMKDAGPSPLPAGSPFNGNGWDQYNDPFVQGLQKALGMGLKGDKAIEWMNANGYPGAVNPSGGGIQYYGDTDMFGLPGGYKVAPNGQGGYDIYQQQGSAFGNSAPAGPSLMNAGAGQTGDANPLLAGIQGLLAGSGSMAPAGSPAKSYVDQLREEFLKRYATPKAPAGGGQ